MITSFLFFLNRDFKKFLTINIPSLIFIIGDESLTAIVTV